MEMRTSKPKKGNKYFTRTVSGGWNGAIKGKPTDACDVLANCVGYANGRFAEIIGKDKIEYQLVCNAENFIEKAQKYGLEITDYPTLGGIMVMQKGASLSSKDGAGHVFINEKIIDENTIYTSESGYNSKAFWNSTRKNTNGRWGMNSKYKFRGNIVNPAIGKVRWVDPEPTPEPEPTPTPEPTVDLLTLVKKTIRGDFGNGEARKKALGENYEEVQRQVNLNYKYGTTRWDNVKLY